MKFKTKLIMYIICITIFRLVVFFLTNPVICPDTQSYIDLAKNIVSFDFSGFNGLRTPGYSLILILSGFNLKITVLIQMFLELPFHI